MKLTLKIWRQNGAETKGQFKSYEVVANEEMSFLEMLDVLNEELINKKEEPVVFDHDCREGICGACSMVINGKPHGPLRKTTTCQLHMRHFKDGDTIYVEPFRSKAFPVIKDLMVDRTAMDRVIQSGGYISANTGGAQDANTIPIAQSIAEKSMDAAACIGCGACVAACPNGAAMLFVSAKINHLNLLPQGEVEKLDRTAKMVGRMEQEGFGACSNIGACEVECPKDIRLVNIARMNKWYFQSAFAGED